MDSAKASGDTRVMTGAADGRLGGQSVERPSNGPGVADSSDVDRGVSVAPRHPSDLDRPVALLVAWVLRMYVDSRAAGGGVGRDVAGGRRWCITTR